MQASPKRPPSRLTLALLSWALVSCAAIAYAVKRHDSAYQDHLAQVQMEASLSAAARHSTESLTLAIALNDTDLVATVAERILENEPGLEGIEVHTGNDERIVRGSTDAALASKRTRVEQPRIDAELLFAGDRLPEALSRTGVGSVTVYLTPSTPAAASAGMFIELGSVLAAVVLSLLGLALWLRSGLRRLVSTATALASGELEHIPASRGGGELEWAAASLSDLREVWSAEFDRVHGRNAALRRDVTLKEDRLERIASFAASLVAPISSAAALDSALAKLAEQTAASVAALVVRGPDGELRVDAVSGLPSPESDARIGAGLDAWPELPWIDETTVLDSITLAHPWLQACDRNIPLEGVAAVPLLFRGNTEGFAIVATRQGLSEDDLAFLADAANPLAIALANRAAYHTVLAVKTQLTCRNEQLVLQKEQLEEVNRLRGQFVANVSHELRTPLNAVIGYADLLLEGCYGDMTDEQREPLESQLKAATSLLDLVNQVLDLSRAEADGIELHTTDVDLHSIADEVVDMSAPLSRERPYTPTLSGDSLLVHTDIGAVRQILRNLLGNAVKFTKTGTVVTRVYLDPVSAQPCVDVEDTGIGIDAESLDVIFEEFRQADGSATREHNGVGLGLAISRRLARALGGDLTVRSRPGEGSTFTLHLPAEAARLTAAAA